VAGVAFVIGRQCGVRQAPSWYYCIVTWCYSCYRFRSEMRCQSDPYHWWLNNGLLGGYTRFVCCHALTYAKCVALASRQLGLGRLPEAVSGDFATSALRALLAAWCGVLTPAESYVLGSPVGCSLSCEKTPRQGMFHSKVPFI